MCVFVWEIYMGLQSYTDPDSLTQNRCPVRRTIGPMKMCFFFCWVVLSECLCGFTRTAWCWTAQLNPGISALRRLLKVPSAIFRSTFWSIDVFSGSFSSAGVTGSSRHLRFFWRARNNLICIWEPNPIWFTPFESNLNSADHNFALGF